MILKKILFFLIVTMLFPFSNKGQTMSTSLDSEVRNITNLNIGFNRRSDNGTWYTDNSFINLVSEMNPDVMRYPGGTQANYWDWRTGQFLDNTDKNWGNKEVVTIPTFLNALPTRTKVIYVVNMARPTPTTGVSVNASEQVLKSDATLNLKIADMIDAIDSFVAQGKEPYAVELGNEFYFGNIESGNYQIVEENGFFYSGWNPNTNAPYQSTNKKDATNINALFYLRHCKEIVSQIKTVYPNIKFAITTTKIGNGSSTRERWNNTIFNNLQNNSEFATLAQDIEAVTQHHYLNDNYGVQTVINSNTSAKVAIAEGIQYPIDKQADYNLVPNNFDVWYTEFGEVKGIAEETWADAVRYIALNYSWLNRGDRVTQLDFHYISDNTVIKVQNPMHLAPVGIASKLLMQASAEMTEMQKINFTNNPISVNNIKSLYGLKFKSDEKETLLIFNTSNTTFSSLDVNNLFSFTGDRNITQYYSDKPYVSGVSEGSNNIKTLNNSTTGIVNIKEFSISVIEVVTPRLSVNNQLNETVSIYPNPVGNKIFIQSKNDIESVSIYSITGALVYQTNQLTENTIELITLKSGVYLVKIKSNKGIHFKKIIKK